MLVHNNKTENVGNEFNFKMAEFDKTYAHQLDSNLIFKIKQIIG